MMIARNPQALPAYRMPAGDIIQRRIDNKYAEKRKAAHHATRRVPMAACPFLPQLLQQEALYSAVLAGQRRVVSQEELLAYEQQVAVSQPAHKPYRLNLELPHTRIGDLLWRVVDVVGNLYDCFLVAWRYSH